MLREVDKKVLDADGVVHLGAKEASDAVAVASKVDAEFARVWEFLAGEDAPPSWTVAPNDGGLALQTAAKTITPASVASEAVKCEP